MKTCYKCQTSKDLSDFHKDKTRNDGLRHICKVCATTQTAKYIELHRDHYRQLSKKHREENEQYYKDYYQKNKENFANSYQANKAHIREQQTKYRKENKFVYNAKNATYRAKKLQSTLNGFEKEIKEIYRNCPEGYHVDHIIPLNNPMVCGLHVPWNLQYLTIEENLKKSNKV